MCLKSVYEPDPEENVVQKEIKAIVSSGFCSFKIIILCNEGDCSGKVMQNCNSFSLSAVMLLFFLEQNFTIFLFFFFFLNKTANFYFLKKEHC